MNANEFFEPEMSELLTLIIKGKEQRAREYIELNKLDLNIHGKDDITPLIWLIMLKSNTEAAKLALNLGADPNFKRANGDNAITMIAGSDDPRRLKALLDAGGDPNSIDRNGMPAIFSAIGQDRMADIELLIESGADLNLRDKSGRNAALYPAFIMRFELAWFFIERGADPLIYSAPGADLAWIVFAKVEDGIIMPGGVNYPWIKKIKQHLIERGVSFPPPSPEQVRDRWEKEGKPKWHQVRGERLKKEKEERDRNK